VANGGTRPRKMSFDDASFTGMDAIEHASHLH
jgi:hypothetical protein